MSKLRVMLTPQKQRDSEELNETDPPNHPPKHPGPPEEAKPRKQRIMKSRERET